MHNVLIAEEQLAQRDSLIENISCSKHEYNLQALEPDVRRAFGRHLVFADEQARQEAGFQILSEHQAFYNAYFWFLVFARRYQESHGHDAGIEQQAFKLLETMPSGTNLSTVEELTDIANGIESST